MQQYRPSNGCLEVRAAIKLSIDHIYTVLEVVSPRTDTSCLPSHGGVHLFPHSLVTTSFAARCPQDPRRSLVSYPASLRCSVVAAVDLVSIPTKTQPNSQMQVLDHPGLRHIQSPIYWTLTAAQLSRAPNPSLQSDYQGARTKSMIPRNIRRFWRLPAIKVLFIDRSHSQRSSPTMMRLHLGPMAPQLHSFMEPGNFKWEMSM